MTRSRSTFVRGRVYRVTYRRAGRTADITFVGRYCGDDRRGLVFDVPDSTAWRFVIDAALITGSDEREAA